MKRLNFFIALLISILFCSILEAETLVVKDDFKSQKTNSNLWFFEDRDNRYDFSTIDQAEFVQDTEHKLNWGIVSYPVWLKIAIEDQRDYIEPLIFAFDYPLLDEVDYRVCYEQEFCESEIKKIGRMRPERRHLDNTAGDEIQILPRKDSRNIYSYTLWIKVRQTAGSLQLTSKLYTQSEQLRVQRQSALGSGIYFGGLLILTVYNLFLCISLKSLKYLFYVLYMSAYLGWQFFTSGYGFGLFGESIATELSAKIIPVGILVFGHAALIFALLFLNLKELAPKLFWISIIYATLGQLSILLSPFLGDQLFYKLVISYIAPIWLILELSCGFAALKSKQYRRSAILFLISWAAFVAGSFTVMLRIIGLVELNFITLYGQQIGSWLESLLMSFAMADVINQLRKQNNQQTHELQKGNDELRKAQSDLQSELKLRANLISNLCHRINNPLNYIALNSQNIEEELKAHEDLLNALLSSSDEDPELASVRKKLNSQIFSLRQASQQIELGLKNSIQSIGDLRNISGIDGYHFEAFSIKDLADNLRLRCKQASGTKLTRVEIDCEDGSSKFVGSLMIVSLAIELILTKVLDQLSHDSYRLEIYSKQKRLILSIRDVDFTHILSEEELSSYLLGAIHVGLSIEDTSMLALSFSENLPQAA